MSKCSYILTQLLVVFVGTIYYALHAEAVPAFARQYDLQCNVCHTRPPRLNSFGEQFHMMGFQIPGAARPGGLGETIKDKGFAQTILDTLALRMEGGIFESTQSPHETESKFVPPEEFTLFVTRPLLPDVSFFVELEAEPNAVVFEDGRYTTKGEVGLGKEAFFMANLGQVLGLIGAPTMQMGNQTMIGSHGGFNMHGPMMMAGKIDPSTNFSYPTNRQLIAATETEVKQGGVERFPVVPYAFASKFFGLFKDQEDGEPQLVTDQVMYNTRGAPGSDFHTMVNNLLIDHPQIIQVGFLRENDGWNAYGAWRVDFGERDQSAFSVSALINWGFGVAWAPDPTDHDRPSDQRVDRLRYGVAANARWKGLDVYGALIRDQVFDLPSGLGGEFDRAATGLTLAVDYLAHEQVMLSTRFDQLWAGGLTDEKQDGSVLSFQVKYFLWQNVAFFVRDSVNLLSTIEDDPLRGWRNQVVLGVDWDF
jgi:hypothetical protein